MHYLSWPTKRSHASSAHVKRIKTKNKINMKINFLLVVLTLVMLISASLMFNSCSPSTSEGNFKSWQCSDVSVVGNLELEDMGGVDYYKISKIDNESTKIENFNSNGILVETVVVKFQGNKLSSIAKTTNQGFTYQIQSFENLGEGNFLETSKTWGYNEHLPCKGQINKFKKGLLLELSYIGFDEKPCECSSGYTTIKYKRYSDENRWGLIQEISYFNKKGEPVISDDYHQVKYQRDERGNVINESYWGIRSNAVKTKFGVHEIKRKSSKDDNMIEMEFFGLSGEPVANIYGTSRLLYEYEDGNMSKITRYNIKNEISEESGTQVNDGAAIIKYNHDERGNTISIAYLDKSEKPMISNMGYHLTKFHIDKDDNTDEEAYFGLNNQPTTDKKGIHKYYYLHDDLGRNTGLAYFDKQNKPSKDDVNLVFMEKYKNDEYGRRISTSYWSDEKTKMTRWSGIHEYRYKYNEQGQEIEVLHLDTEGNLKKSSSGESRWVTEYDEYSRVSAYGIFDGEIPVLMTDAAQVSNYHKRTFEYDSQSRIIKIEYFDKEGNPIEANVNRTDKVQKIEIEYQGNSVVRENWYRKGSAIPSKVLDCITSQCMRTIGNGMEYLNK